MAATKEAIIETVTIKVENRDGGGIFISSDDVPGLWLWGDNPEQVFQSVIPTIKELYKLNLGKNVDVKAVEKHGKNRFSAVEAVPHTFNIYKHTENQNASLNG